MRELIGKRFIFGICMGHQILGRALGGQTYKLKFGHRGSNHPIKDSLLNKIYMTSQNHGYAVKQETLAEDRAGHARESKRYDCRRNLRSDQENIERAISS